MADGSAGKGRSEHFDVLVVGAGLSGIGAGWHLQDKAPGRSYAILEGREAIGGTWDLFRYPGIRSDSDMYTLGYAFKPWTEAKAIADGPSILKYVRETARDYGIDKKIRYGHQGHRRVLVEFRRWLLDRHGLRSEAPAETPSPLTCGFLLLCTGYYSYAAGYTPDFHGRGSFPGYDHRSCSTGPPNLDYADKQRGGDRPGATAMTLVPAMADKAAKHITMLQRSADLRGLRPAEDAIANKLRARAAGQAGLRDLIRWRNVLFGMWFFRLARKNRPRRPSRDIIDMVRAGAGPRLRHRHPFHPTLQPLGSAHVPGAQRRPVRGDQGGQEPPSSPTRSSHFTESGIDLKPRARPSRRHRRHRHRPGVCRC